MQDKMNTPSGGGDFASADDLKKLAGRVQEIDKNRQEDNQKILDAIGKLGKRRQCGRIQPRHTPEISTTPTTGNTTRNAQYRRRLIPKQVFECT